MSILQSSSRAISCTARLTSVSRISHSAVRAVSCSLAASSQCAVVSPLPSFVQPSTASSSASFHSSTHLRAIWDSAEVKEKKKTQAEQAAIKAGFQKMMDIYLRDNYNLEAYEELMRLISGEAAPDAGIVARTKAAIGQKLQSFQGKQTPAETKQALQILAEFTPEEKKAKKIPSHEACERVAKKLSIPLGEVKLLLDQYDLSEAMSGWFHWRRKTGRSLPISPQDMQDRMKVDRKEHHQPRLNKMDARQVANKKSMMHGVRKER